MTTAPFTQHLLHAHCRTALLGMYPDSCCDLGVPLLRHRRRVETEPSPRSFATATNSAINGQTVIFSVGGKNKKEKKQKKEEKKKKNKKKKKTKTKQK